ncbi:MAG: response regulator transcription factor [Hyphomicrobiaceae bacterium]
MNAKSPKNDTIRVAVVDDHPLMREGIVQSLGREPDLEIVAEGASAAEAIAIATTLLPDVMLIDVNMPGGGLEALREISATCPAVATIIITVREDEETVGNALAIGARGFMTKGVTGASLAQTIREINGGAVYITPSLAARLLTTGSKSQQEKSTQLANLSDREAQILRLIVKGMINKQIGAELGLREKTIKHYVTNILQKLHVRNRVEAALIGQHRLPNR